jgi:flagellar basal-body rod protein FlgC
MSGLFGQLDISASGMAAERLRLQIIAENLANANSTKGADGQPYRRKSVTLQEVQGTSFDQVLGGVEATPSRTSTPSPRWST